MGLTVTKGSEAGFITASHCTQPHPHNGGSTGRVFYQPTDQAGNRIGYESIDPGFSAYSVCPANHVCRNSDSAYIRFDSTTDYDRGHIAKPLGIGSITIDHSNTFRITAEAPNVFVNDWVHNVGRSNGWKKGRIQATCNNYQAIAAQGNNPEHTFTCQNRHRTYTFGGDSGGPVFSPPDSNNDVRLHGILWGGTLNDTIYSPINRIYNNLGPSLDWNPCASGINC